MTKMVHQGLILPGYIYQQNEFYSELWPQSIHSLEKGQLLLSDCYHYHNEMHVRRHVNDSTFIHFLHSEQSDKRHHRLNINKL